MKRNRKKKESKPIKIKHTTVLNKEVLNSVCSPNVWTPKSEDAWHRELNKITAGEIYSKFPPLKKPGNVSRRGRNYGWGNR